MQVDGLKTQHYNNSRGLILIIGWSCIVV